jgi:hypothetical protein
MTISESSIEASAKLDTVKAAYECHDYRNAVSILTVNFPELLIEICDVLVAFHLNVDQIKKAGGNESEIPKTFAALLRPLGWAEKKLEAKLVVDEDVVSQDTHKIDFVKGKVALDLEWNSKDQTFDRDLYAFRAFFEYHKIAVAILITRSISLDEVFKELGSYVDPKTGESKRYMQKYGASTTHLGKLLTRLRAGRSGGCPVLAIGITPKQFKR